MNTKHVYKLLDGTQVVYIGETSRPEKRLLEHTKRRDGKFYNQNITMEIVASGLTRKEALNLEKDLKLEYGFELTENAFNKPEIHAKRDSRPGGIATANKTRIFTREQAIELKRLYDTGNYTYRSLAKEFNTNHVRIIKTLQRYDIWNTTNDRRHGMRHEPHPQSTDIP